MEYFAFQWHITEACDQRCRHCYIYALGSHAKFQEMALEDMVTMIENCKTSAKRPGGCPSTSHLWFSLEYVLECRIFNNYKSDFL